MGMKQRQGIIARLVGLACLLMPVAAGAAQQCPPMPAASLDLRVSQSPPVYRNDRGRAEVARLAGKGMPGYAQQGLTQTQTEFQAIVLVNVVMVGPNRYCVGLGRVEAEWRLDQLEVDIVREHPPGTCPHAVIRAHEDQHVAIAQRLFARHSGPVRARLTQLVHDMRPQLTALPPAQANRMMRDRLLAGMTATLAAFDSDLAQANAVLDTPQSYRAETAKCPKWD